MQLSPHHIPAIIHMEGICGPLLAEGVSLPSGIARGASFDPELEEKLAAVVARQETACGITQIFAPVLDVAADPRFGRSGESYGEDPTLVGQMGSANVRGTQGTEVEKLRADAVAKHFVAFHRGAGGIHQGWVDVAERPLREVYAKGFQAAIDTAALKGVMPCYSIINGEPVHGSKALLQDLLRKDMGFDGLVVSDYGGINNMFTEQMLCESAAEAGLRGLEAGVDQELQIINAYNHELLDRLMASDEGRALLDASVLRVLEAKFRMGLFERPFALQGEALEKAFHAPEDRELTLQSAREAQILLKNDGTLPLKKTYRRIAVIGCHADDASYFFGGYTRLSMTEGRYAQWNTLGGIESTPWQKGEYVPIPGTKIQRADTEEFRSILRTQQPDCPSLLRKLKESMPDTEFVYAYGYPMAGDDCSHHEEAIRAAKNADLILMTLGGRYGTSSVSTMSEGVDATNICLPACQDRLIEKLAALGIPMVGVHFDGRPISSDAADAHLNAILEAWTLSECGAQAIAETLLGRNNPSGRLPVTVARNAGQLPLLYNHPNGSSWHQGRSIGFRHYMDLPHTPRYPFGYGLSYTTFAYDDLSLDRAETAPDTPVVLSFTLKNTGMRDGTEVVQLYLRDPHASMARPVKQLAGFRRVALKAGEAKRISFALSPGVTAFLDRDMRWKIEHGTIELMVGASSEDVRLQTQFTITGDAWIGTQHRPLWAESREVQM